MWSKISAITKSKVYKLILYSFLAVIVVFGCFIFTDAFKQKIVYSQGLVLDGLGIELRGDGEYYMAITSDTAITVNSINPNVTNKRVRFQIERGSGFAVTNYTMLGSSALVSLDRDAVGVPSVVYAEIGISCGTTYVKCNLIIDYEINEVKEFVKKSGVDAQMTIGADGVSAHKFHWSEVYAASDVFISSEAYSSGVRQNTYLGVDALMNKLTRYQFHAKPGQEADAWNVNPTNGKIAFKYSVPIFGDTYKFSVTQQVKFEGTGKTLAEVETIVHYFYITITLE